MILTSKQKKGENWTLDNEKEVFNLEETKSKYEVWTKHVMKLIFASNIYN